MADNLVCEGEVLKLKGDYGFIKPLKDLPSNFNQKDVHFFISCFRGDEPLTEGEYVLFRLDKFKLDKPQAILVWPMGSPVTSKVPSMEKVSHAIQEIKQSTDKIMCVGIVISLKDEYGFLQSIDDLPSEFQQKNVHFMKSHFHGAEPVEQGDYVKFLLDKSKMDRPQAQLVWAIDAVPGACGSSTGPSKDRSPRGNVRSRTRSRSASQRRPTSATRSDTPQASPGSKDTKVQFEQTDTEPKKARRHGIQQKYRGLIVSIKNPGVGFLKAFDTLPPNYNQKKDIHFVPEKVNSVGMELVEGDSLEFTLGTHDKSRPSAFKVNLAKCKARSPDVVEGFIRKTLSRLQDDLGGETEVKRGEFIIGLVSCIAVWQCMCNCWSLSDNGVRYLMELLCVLEQNLKGLQQNFKNLLSKITSESFFNPWGGRLKEFITTTFRYRSMKPDVQKIRKFLLMIVRHVPSKARAVASLVKPMVSADEDTVENLLYILLKETARLSCDSVEDMEWDELPLVPSPTELLSGPLESQINLSPVKKKGPYSSAQEYMDIYFRLFRTDCFSALRTGIGQLLRGKLDWRDMKVYHSVQLAGIQVTNSDTGIALALKFEPQQKVQNWATSSNLMFGNLLCLSASGTFRDAIWATVANRDLDLLKKESVILVELCTECNTLSDPEVITHLVHSSGSIVMAESPTYYRAYQPVMRALQAMDPTQLPFQEELVNVQETVAPDYVNSGTIVDPSVIYSVPKKQVFLEELHRHKVANGWHTTLDASQEDAVLKALSQRVAVIQGPPGTGKTFIGVKLIQLLLSMSSRPASPILVLTYKNHALDELLKDLQHLYPESVVRIGGRSQEAELERCNLNKLQRSVHKSPALLKQLIPLYAETDELKNRVQIALKNMDCAKSFNSAVFLKHATEEQVQNIFDKCNWKMTGLKMEKSIGTKMQKVPLTKDHVAYYVQGKNLYQYLSDNVENEQDMLVSWFKSALWQWCRPDVFQHAETHFLQQNKILAALNESNDASSIEDLVDERDIEDQQKERLAAVMDNTKTVRKEEIFRFGKSKQGPGKYVPELFSTTKEMVKNGLIPVVQLQNTNSLWELDDLDRVKLVQLMLLQEVEEAAEELKDALLVYQQVSRAKSELENQHKIAILRDRKIIGVTITGASIHQHLLSQLKADTVVVEEAGEVLEPQLLPLLGSWTKQIILIGDHKQLRPPVESYVLRRDFHLDISMMERIIENNGLYSSLALQNRMRPEFAELLLDIYPALKSNLSRVQNNLAPTCVKTSMFFWDHDDIETSDRSYSNEKEAEKSVRLSLFMLQQGYRPTQITILAAYQGQVALIRKKIRKVEDEYPQFFPEETVEDSKDESDKFKIRKERIAVHTVDLYQGDENDIVIVSLVRSNPKRKVGFVNELNRRCVAQSRSRCGLYFIGNIKTLSASNTWKILLDKMNAKQCVGRTLTLHCPRHPTSTIQAKLAEDITQSDFCKMKCLDSMPCKVHPCPNLCQPPHSHSVCKVEVPFFFPCGHLGKRKCFQSDSDFICQRKISFTFKCGHPGERKCSQAESELKCNQQVPFKFSNCGHLARKKCYQQENDLKCRERCPRTLPCGHICQGECGYKCIPENCAECEKIREAEAARRRKAEEERIRLAKEQVKLQIEKLKRQPRKACCRVDLHPEGDTAAEYFDVQDRVKKYVLPGHNWFPAVSRIEKVTNLALEEKWMHVQLEMHDPTHKEMKFHGTGADAVNAIVESGFLLPAPSRDNMFGRGIYFATDSSKSAQSLYTKGSNMLLLCEVLLGRTKTVNTAKKDASLEKLKKEGYDSLYAQRGTKNTGGVLNDEFVVYRPEQAIVRYIVHYRSTSLQSPNSRLLETQAVASQNNTVKCYPLKPKREFKVDDPLDIHFRIAESQFLRLHKSGGAQWKKYEVDSIDYYVNPPLIRKFTTMEQVMKRKYAGKTEAECVLAFHGTQSQNMMAIVKENFRLDRIQRTVYGKGIYFSEFPDVSLGYGGSLLLCKVLPGKSHKGGTAGQDIPRGYDSNIVTPDQEGRGQMIVINNPDQILPCYVINLKQL